MKVTENLTLRSHSQICQIQNGQNLCQLENRHPTKPLEVLFYCHQYSFPTMLFTSNGNQDQDKGKDSYLVYSQNMFFSIWSIMRCLLFIWSETTFFLLQTWKKNGLLHYFHSPSYDLLLLQLKKVFWIFFYKAKCFLLPLRAWCQD